MCFLLAYLSPLQDADEPFAGIREALREMPTALDDEPAEFALIPRGPHGGDDPEGSTRTLAAYRAMGHGRGGCGRRPGRGIRGRPRLEPERRFERLFERLALPGL